MMSLAPSPTAEGRAEHWRGSLLDDVDPKSVECACIVYSYGEYDDPAAGYSYAQDGVDDRMYAASMSGQRLERSLREQAALLAKYEAEMRVMRGMNERLIRDKIERDNAEGIKLLDRAFGLGPTNGVKVDSVDSMLEDYADPGESAEDLVRSARDRF